MNPEDPERDKRFQTAQTAITAGIWASVALMVMKLLAGHFGHSKAVFADGIESATDLLVGAVGIAALKIGSKPLDKNHPYGHGKAESIAAFFVSLVILAAGAGILYSAITTIAERNYTKPGIIAVAAALITIAGKETLFRYTRRISKKTESPTLEAIAADHRKDAVASTATLIGVGGAYFGAAFLDPAAAGLTSLFIFTIGWKTFRKTCNDLMDAQPSKEIMVEITQTAAGVAGVDRVHEVRVRRSGQNFIVDIKIDMNPEMTVRESHDVATQVRRRIFDKHPRVGDIMIHVHPTAEDHDDMTRL